MVTVMLNQKRIKYVINFFKQLFDLAQNQNQTIVVQFTRIQKRIV